MSNRSVSFPIRIMTVLLSSVLLFSLTACQSSSAPGEASSSSSETSLPPTGPYYSSPDEVTAEKIQSMTIPATILGSIRGFRNDFILEASEETNRPEASVSSAYIKEEGMLYGTQFVDYADGQFTHIYFTNDPRDPYMYAESPSGHERSKTDSATIEYIFKTSFLGYDQMESLSILSVTKVKPGDFASDLPLSTDGEASMEDLSTLISPEELARLEIPEFYVVLLKTEAQGAHYSTDVLLIDPDTGRIHSVVVHYPADQDQKETSQKMTFFYDENLVLDRSPKTGEKPEVPTTETANNNSKDSTIMNPLPESSVPEVSSESSLTEVSEGTKEPSSLDLGPKPDYEGGMAPTTATLEDRPILSFTTVDIHGQSYSSEEFKEAKLVLVNLWEPWCGPCVREMPDLERLYEKYKDQGLIILGAYSDTRYRDDAVAIIAQNKITYPIIVAENTLKQCATSYVPTSFFLLGDGRLYSTQPIVGAQSYEAWEALIQATLEAVSNIQ